MKIRDIDTILIDSPGRKWTIVRVFTDEGLVGLGEATYSQKEPVVVAAVEHLKEFFAARNKPLAQVAVAWVLAQPEVTSPIVGATSVEQLEQSLPAVEMSLDEEEMELCNDLWFSLPRLRDKAVALR